MIVYPYLNDLNFLTQVFETKVREHYVKITVLDWEERTIAEVQSRINSGSISINGDSTLRRTGSLTTVLDEKEYDFDYINNLFGLNKKIIIEKGLKNPFSDKYSDYPILWFPLGLYIITGLNITQQITGSIQLSITIQDKMCLLNGTISGVLPAATVLDKYTYKDENDNEVVNAAMIRQIIYELVHHWGGEQIGNILVTGVPERNIKVKTVNKDSELIIISTIENSPKVQALTVLPTIVIDSQVAAATAYVNGETGEFPDEWTLKDEYVDDYQLFYPNDYIGYTWEPLTYTGNKDGLVAQQGETITSVLDKLVSYLNNVEYFYDVYGRFVFQEKQNNLNISESNDIKNLIEEYNFQLNEKVDLSSNKNISYILKDDMLITAKSISPMITNLKNDFIVWGMRTIGEEKYPICYQTCIDDIPEIPANIIYEVYYYKDETGLWQAAIANEDTPEEKIVRVSTNKMKQWQTYLYYKGLQDEVNGLDTSYYFLRLRNEWPKVFNLRKNKFYDKFLQEAYNSDFYLELVDTYSTTNYNVKNIGRRTIVKQSDKINCLFSPTVPDFVFVPKDTSKDIINEILAQNNNYRIIKVTENWLAKHTSTGDYTSAYSVIRDMMYQYTDFNETIQFSVLPIYTLIANKRIDIKSEQYWIKSVNVPLESSGLMSITATKILHKF